MANYARGKEKHPGRPKGSVNKVTGLVREEIWTVYHRLGRGENFLKWAKTHKDEFYHAFMRLACTEGPMADGAQKLVVEIVKFANAKDQAPE
jgi:hypothetical protein